MISTAIKRGKPSNPARWLVEHGLVPDRKVDNSNTVLDFGCGRGDDCKAYGWDGFDPAFTATWTEQHYDFVICTYVLNVVTRSVQSRILKTIRELGDIQYVAVRRDLPQQGKPGRGCYQRYVTLSKAAVVTENKGFCLYRL